MTFCKSFMPCVAVILIGEFYHILSCFLCSCILLISKNKRHISCRTIFIYCCVNMAVNGSPHPQTVNKYKFTNVLPTLALTCVEHFRSTRKMTIIDFCICQFTDQEFCKPRKPFKTQRQTFPYNINHYPHNRLSKHC